MVLPIPVYQDSVLKDVLSGPEDRGTEYMRTYTHIYIYIHTCIPSLYVYNVYTCMHACIHTVKINVPVKEDEG